MTAGRPRVTASTLTRELQRLGLPYVIRQRRGYVEIDGGDSTEWYTSSLEVCYVRDLGETLDAAVARVLRHRDDMRARRPGAPRYESDGNGGARLIPAPPPAGWQKS